MTKVYDLSSGQPVASDGDGHASSQASIRQPEYQPEPALRLIPRSCTAVPGQYIELGDVQSFLVTMEY